MCKILVSACLLGDPVRYDGQCKEIDDTDLSELVKHNRVVPFCPEIAGGLPIPRDMAEIQQGDGYSVIDGIARVRTLHDQDVTEQFQCGAKLALELCQQYQIRIAILTESSPSCGSHQIYDGSFSRSKREGIGVTTALLIRHGISVFNQNQVGDAMKFLIKLSVQV